MSHTAEEDLHKKLQDAQKIVEIGAVYTNYKNPEKKYIIEFIGFLEATEEVCVCYRALYGNGTVWVRTLENFCQKVETPSGLSNRFNKAK